MPKITSCPPSTIRNLPPEIMGIIFEKIHENEKTDDYELSHSMDMRHLGEAFIPDFVRKPGSVKNPYTQQKATPREIYNVLILKLVSNTNFPLELFNSLLDSFVEEKIIDLEAALTLPSAQKRKDLELHIIQRTDLMIRALKEEAHFEKLQENIQDFPLECIGFGKTLCENLSNIPAHLREFFLKEGNKLIGHTEGNALLHSLPKADGAFGLKRIISALHPDHLGNFIIGLIKKQPDALSNQAYFHALTNRLEEVSYKDLSLIFELINRSPERFAKGNYSYIFHILALKIYNFPRNKERELLLIELASMVKYIKTNPDEEISFLIYEIGIATENESALSTRVQVLKKLVSHLSIFAEGQGQSQLLELVENNTLNIPNDQIGIILAELAKNVGTLKSEAFKLDALNLIKSNLPNIPNNKNQIGMILIELAKNTHWRALESEALRSGALNLIKKNLPTITNGTNQIGIILTELAENMVMLLSEPLKLDALNLITSSLPNNLNQVEIILTKLAENVVGLGPETLQSHAIDFIENKLPDIHSNTISKILSTLSIDMGAMQSNAIRQRVSDLVKSNRHFEK